MTKRHSPSSFEIWAAWARSHNVKSKDVIAASAVILGCIAAGVLALRVPVHHAYMRARVKAVTTRLGDKRPGAWVFVETQDGRTATLSTRVFHPDLKAGAEICLQELKDKFKSGRWFVHATVDRCLAEEARQLQSHNVGS